MQRVAKFEKVSFEQFKKDWADTFYVTDGIEKIYEDISFRKEQRQARQVMIFMHRWHLN